MPSNILRLFGWIIKRPYIPIALLLWPIETPAQSKATYPSVRLDLNARSFLTPLPFDQSFQIQGYAPQDMTHLQVSFEEFFDTEFLVSQQPNTLSALETEVRTLLDSLNLPAGHSEISPRSLRRQLTNLLHQHKSPTSGKSMGSVANILPWNWGNVLKGKRSQHTKLVTTGSMFDPSESGTPLREKFNTLAETVMLHATDSQKELASDRLFNFVMNEIKKVRVATVSNAPNAVTQGSWQKLNTTHSVDNTPSETTSDSRWNRLEQRLQGNAAAASRAFRVIVPPLKANRTYLIRVQTDRNSPSDSIQTSTLNTIFWSDTQSNNYVSLDVGLLYVPEIKETSVYIGSNFYLRPVAKNVPLQTRGGLLRRLSFTIGLAFQDIENERQTRRALFGPMSAVLGAGIRVSKYVRAGGGVLIFRERDPETFPLTTRTSLAGSPYVSASFDLDVGNHLKGLSRLFGITERGDTK